MKNKKILLPVIAVILVAACVAVAFAVSVHLKREANWNALVESFDPLIGSRGRDNAEFSVGEQE